MPERQKIGYITIEQSDNDYRGALLVVDFRGIPLDFRYTDSVSPTRLEKVLYGGSLDVYIKEEVILDSLIKANEEKPDLWVCRDRYLLTPLIEKVKVPVVFLEGTSRKPLDEPGKYEPLLDDGSYLIQLDLMGPPYRADVINGKDLNSISSILTDVSATMEILEPFDRIKRAFDAMES